VDAANNVYVADSGNDRIRKITPAGVVSTFAGGTRGYLDGVGTAARFYDPYGLAVDAAGNVFVSERFNHRIRKITPAGVVTTVAGSGEIGEVDATGVAASFNHPQGLAVAASGDLIVVDTDNQRIRRVTQAGVVTTLAGSGLASYADGTGPAASFFFPYNVALDVDGNAYFGDQYNHRIRKMTPTNVVTTIAGSGAEAFADGVGAAASFNYPSGVAVDASRNVYVADYLNSRIRRVSPTGVVTTFAGGAEPEYIDGATPAARFNFAVALTIAADGTFYVADLGNVRVRKIVSTGIGRLAVSWAAPSSSGGAPITKYVAKAAAPGMPTATCTTTGATSCTFERLTSSVAYAITVVATNAGGDGPASAVGTGTPN
jgi:sugar lactone lactonase YvrE